MKPRPPSAASGRPVGIKDIAKALGVSIGTVDRALHDKPGINARTRERVLHEAEALGYRPNLAARHLKSGRSFHVSVHLPREIALFWDSLREGIEEAAAHAAPGLSIEFRTYPGLGDGDIPLFRAALRRGTDALIIAPGDPAALGPWIRKAAGRQIPVVCVVTDAPGTERLTSVSADPFTVGGVAGELMARIVSPRGTVAFFTGWLTTQDHAEKLRGFQTSLSASGRYIGLAAVVEAHDDERTAYQRTASLLRTHHDVRGIYVSTVNSLPVLQAAMDLRRLDRLTVVTTDLFPALVPWVRTGRVAATIYQRPRNQGRVAIRALHDYLLRGIQPAVRIKLVPHVVMRSNIDLVLERLRIEPAAGADGPRTPLAEAADEGTAPPGAAGRTSTYGAATRVKKTPATRPGRTR